MEFHYSCRFLPNTRWYLFHLIKYDNIGYSLQLQVNAINCDLFQRRLTHSHYSRSYWKHFPLNIIVLSPNNQHKPNNDIFMRFPKKSSRRRAFYTNFFPPKCVVGILHYIKTNSLELKLHFSKTVYLMFIIFIELMLARELSTLSILCWHSLLNC